MYIAWWIFDIPVHNQLSSAVGEAVASSVDMFRGDVEASELFALCVNDEWSWKFDFSEAYNNCQCLQF